MEGYVGIDVFRLIAAFLVVANHTSPLGSFSETGDFILTRVVCRVAVPFFFMTSGFFLISRYSCDAKKLTAFLKKTACIYGTAILLYLPLNFYSHSFDAEYLLPNLIRDIVFDGTFYHLWYLPASMIGAAIAWYLVRRTSWRNAFLISGLLYVIGLFGDSYYGIAEMVPGVKQFYQLLFQVTDYTRNGMFFAPVFFVAGGYLAEREERSVREGLYLAVPGFLTCFALMLAEALLLHHFGLQRHDSMYLFLVPAMYFFFQFLLQWKGGRQPWMRTASLMIYLIHPFVIVLVRLAAKLTHLTGLLVENSLVHYMTVCVVSALLSFGLALLWEQWRQFEPTARKHGLAANRHNPTVRRRNPATDRAWLEIDRNNLEHNVSVIQSALPQGCELMAVAKAECYGHGMYEIPVRLEKMGVSAFAVAMIDEGIRLRRYGIRGEILILGYTSPMRARELCRYRLTQTLIDYPYAVLLNRQGYKIKAHLKIDTGMHRLGFDPAKIREVTTVFSMERLQITGIFTHLCCSDSREQEDIAFTNQQIDRFYELIDCLKQSGIKIPKIHIQSSYGLLNYPKLACDYVRIGISLYGVYSELQDEGKTELKLDLRPVLSLKARVVLLRDVKKGESVGYGRAFRAERNSRIAILPIGYADGVPRSLSCSAGSVLICGQKAPIIGRICMDQLAVDVTDIPNVKIGSIATLIGSDKAEQITAPEAAAWSKSIANELLSRMGRRLEIVYKDSL